MSLATRRRDMSGGGLLLGRNHPQKRRQGRDIAARVPSAAAMRGLKRYLAAILAPLAGYPRGLTARPRQFRRAAPREVEAADLASTRAPRLAAHCFTRHLAGGATDRALEFYS